VYKAVETPENCARSAQDDIVKPNGTNRQKKEHGLFGAETIPLTTHEKTHSGTNTIQRQNNQQYPSGSRNEQNPRTLIFQTVHFMPLQRV
jgi:hypothetical protein